MVAAARAGNPLRVVDDQVVAPTYAPDLARAILALVDAGARGVVHVTGGGQASWHELAVAALAEAGVPASVTPVSSRDLGAAAARPPCSVLDNGRAIALGLPPPRPWREALHEMCAEE
jgi:dTDP-4-dehydrorhamnose reductase